MPSCIIRIHQADDIKVDTLHARNEIVHYEACMQAGRISTIYRYSIEKDRSNYPFGVFSRGLFIRNSGSFTTDREKI